MSTALPDFGPDLLADNNLDGKAYRVKRGAQDLYVRSKTGAAASTIVSLTYLLTLGDWRQLPWYALVPTGLYGLLALLRFLNRVPGDFAEASEFDRWQWRHWLMIDLGCLIWSGHMLHAGWIAATHPLSLMLSLTGFVAFSVTICHSLAMTPRAALVALGLLSFPGIVAFATIFPGGSPIAVGLTGFSLYALIMLQRSTRDYARQLATDHALIISRAETERLVRIDSLTGLANRRDYERRFEQAWHMAARRQGDLALLVLDLDNFKKLNDCYGHAAGDACLRHFSAILSSHFRRAGDLAARIGGEEFAVILPGISAELAAELGEAFRQELAASPCTFQGTVIPVTASIGAGAADWSADPDPIATFARIDQACYQAKQQGRSRLVCVS